MSNFSGLSLLVSLFGNGSPSTSLREFINPQLVSVVPVGSSVVSTLTGISIFCLANQDSPWFTRIFGRHCASFYGFSPGSCFFIGGAAGNEGLGMFSLCLDWNYVGSGGGSLGALFTPLSTQLSLYSGTAICM